MSDFVGPLGNNLTPESIEIDYQISGTWVDTMAGVPILLDDGAEWDTLTGRATFRLAPLELQSLYDTVRNGTQIAFRGSSYALGPDIPLTGQNVSIIGWAIDGPADSTATLYDVTLDYRYSTLPTPTGGDLDYLMAHGESYPTLEMDGQYVAKDTGESWSSSPCERAELKWYCRGLTTDQAAKIIRGLRALRGDWYTWTIPSGMVPFGYPTNATVQIKIPEFKISKLGTMLWEIESRFVADGYSLAILAGYGIRYGLSYGIL